MEELSLKQLGLLVGIIMALVKLIEIIVMKLIEKFGSNSQKADPEDKAHQLMVQQLELMNSNHLNHIESAINTGNDKIVNAIYSSNDKMVKAIGDMHLDIVKELNRKQ